MQLSAKDITIAVTVYRRLDYLGEALASAVGQTVPVRVILLDDGCQDLAALQTILDRFGDRVEYRRNSGTLGLFRNMNACIEGCPTAWLSILHDDDRLAPDFVERILEVSPEAEGAALFCGASVYLRPDGQPFHRLVPEFAGRWRKLGADDFAYRTWFPFPGQLMHAPTARAVGGFPEKSLYTGDWDLWFRLALAGGVVQLKAELGLHRVHLGADRGTTAAAKTGRKSALIAMQVKRNLGRLRRAGAHSPFDRGRLIHTSPPLYRDLLVYAAQMPSWLLRYNRQLLLLARPPGRVSRVLNTVSHVFGNVGIRTAARARLLGERVGLKMPQTF